ncbi:gamma-glutamyl-gamma-aminobutyrate hydrolase family protein [Leucobacter denitrificans]|uniref:Gamma-glutamyl-gamma-aminobutyrate hydrolase family protein n=2 Tax=Leucobacter denitrificans TaxID=683042 RepID=A0A7G9S7X5_9MICO|nr:gamma-glutamyl-gamma-aminobutyrate hydrolase family protein [Leucobacter denitrificans]
MWSNQIHGLRFDGSAVASAVLRSVIRAGGEPHSLFAESNESARDRLRGFDALLVPGGSDVDPARYGESPHEATSTADFAAQDQFEADMMAAATELQMPVLAICRGFQLLNVEYGGSLVQDVPVDSMHRNSVHAVDLEPDSALAKVMEVGALEVSSYHHQAVARVGEGLRVVGTAEDGVPEALELADNATPLLAIQWHPEDTAAKDPKQHALFQWLVDEARLYRSRK